jgi:hypothetical protein
MKKLAPLFTGLLVALLFAQPARALQISLEATLDGAQAGTPSTGTGSASLLLDDVTNMLSVSLTYSGLLYPTVDAHIHCCAPPGTPAVVIIPFVPPFVLGNLEGTFDQTFAISDEQEAMILSGGAYINIHTSVFTLGEIRGQIVPTPEPSTLAAMAVGLAALGARGWRRAR